MCHKAKQTVAARAGWQMPNTLSVLRHREVHSAGVHIVHGGRVLLFIPQGNNYVQDANYLQNVGESIPGTYIVLYNGILYGEPSRLLVEVRRCHEL